MSIKSNDNNVLNWASIIEDNTLRQAEVTARMPFLGGPVALMPDAHLGYGSTVGSVIATKGAVMPAAIGVDIGCGLGNPASYTSASHGAGRVMSRSQARRDLSTDSLVEAMAGRAWNSKEVEKVVDEHPAAYKPIETVMRDQADLVEPVVRLEQILSYKGTS